MPGPGGEGDLVRQLQPALHRLQNWAYPDEVDHDLFAAFMKTAHDVGGEPDIPVTYEEKEEEQWELNTFVSCEVLGWQGIWTSEERRRLGNVDVGRTNYFGVPYYGRWLLAIARLLVDKQYVTLGEVLERVDAVRERAQSHPGHEPLEASPQASGDPNAVSRNTHHTEAVGKGDPQCFTGMAGVPKLAVGDQVRIRTWPTFFYTRTQEYVRGASGIVVRVSYESPAPEDEAFARDDQPPEWFYIVRFKMTDLWDPYGGCPQDTLQSEFPERWLEPVS